MVLGSSDTQGQTMSSVGEARIASYNEAISALSSFNSAVDLQGVAYDSGKQYGMNVITPLIKGAIMYTELLSEAVPKLPSKYRSEVGGEDLDSAVLESEIRSLESSISSLRGLYNTLLHDETTSASTLSSLSSRIDALTRQKNEKMEKLRKLNLFAGSSNEVFSVGVGYDLIASLAQNLQAGFSQIKTEFANFGGTFSSHSNDMEWAKNIEGEWTKKAKIDEDYQQVLRKIEVGKELSSNDVKAIQAYKNRHPGKELPENVKNEIQDFVDRTEAELLTMAQEVAKEQGISVEKAIDFILQQTESADKTSKFAKLLDKVNLARAELNFINGRQITSNSNGRVKIGSRFLYNKNTEHVYTRGNKEYRQETGKNFDSTDTNIGKGVKTTGWQAALGDAVDSAKRSFKQSIKFWDSKFWDDFNWKDASKLSKWGKAGKFFGAFGTVLNIGGNIKENFWDDKTSSVGGKFEIS